MAPKHDSSSSKVKLRAYESLFPTVKWAKKTTAKIRSLLLFPKSGS